MSPLNHVVADGRHLDSVGVPRVLGGSLAGSIVRIQGSRIDRAEVLDTAALAGLGDLAARAFEDAGSE